MNFECYSLRGGGGGVSAGAGISVTGNTVSLNNESQQSLANVQYITHDSVPSIGLSTAVDSNLAVGLDTFLFRDLHQQRGTDMLVRELPAVVSNNLLCGSGEGLTTGDRNILHGRESLPTLSTGSDNVAIGYKVGAGVSSGDRNVFVGCNTISVEPYCTNSSSLGEGVQTKTNSCCIGQYSQCEESCVVVGAQATAAGARSVVVGRLAGSIGADTVVVGMNSSCVSGGSIALGSNVVNDDVGTSSCVIANGLSTIRSSADITTDLGTSIHRFREGHVEHLLTSEINGRSPVGGMYVGIDDSNLILGNTTGSLLPSSGIGSLIIPAYTLVAGDSFHLVCSGDIPQEAKSDQITVQLTATGSGGATVSLCTVTMDMETSSGESHFELECDWTMRSTGSTAVGVTSVDLTFNKRVEKDFKGTRQVQLLTIDSTLEQTIGLVCTITGGTTQLQTRMFYLTKVY